MQIAFLCLFIINLSYQVECTEADLVYPHSINRKICTNLIYQDFRWLTTALLWPLSKQKQSMVRLCRVSVCPLRSLSSVCLVGSALEGKQVFGI